MKFVAMNGWKNAPHHWWRYIVLPFSWERFDLGARGHFRISLFGFALFWYW